MFYALDYEGDEMMIEEGSKRGVGTSRTLWSRGTDGNLVIPYKFASSRK